MSAGTPRHAGSGRAARVDHELLLRAVDGDSAAFARLAERYAGMLHSIAARYFLVGADDHDVRQEALIGLLNACVAFDFSGRSSFAAFAHLCIERQIITALKASQRLKHAPLNDALRLEMPLSRENPDAAQLGDTLPSGGHENPARVAQTRADVRVIVGQLPGQLTELEATVLGRVLNGAPLTEAGRGLGRATRSAKTADNAMGRVRRKARRLLEGEAA